MTDSQRLLYFKTTERVSLRQIANIQFTLRTARQAHSTDLSELEGNIQKTLRYATKGDTEAPLNTVPLFSMEGVSRRTVAMETADKAPGGLVYSGGKLLKNTRKGTPSAAYKAIMDK